MRILHKDGAANPGGPTLTCGVLRQLVNRMRFLKDKEDGRKEMSSVAEQYAKQEADAKAHAVLLMWHVASLRQVSTRRR